MSDIKLNATFEAFRKHERGGVLIMLSIAYLLIAFILFGLFFWANFSAFGEIITWYGQMIQAATSGGDPSMASANPPTALLSVMPGYVLLILALFVLLASFEAGCLRWILRGESGGVLGLTLGADTWRVYSGYWVWFGLYLGFYIASLIVVGVIAAILGASGDVTLTGIVVSLLALTLTCAGIYFAVRLAPAAATSVAQGKFSFFKAWTVTRGRFWSLFGAFLLLMVLYIVGAFVLYIVAAAIIGLMMAPMLMQSGGAMAPGQMMSALSASLASPTGLVAILAIYGAYIALATVLYVCFFGVNARAALVAREEGKLPS